MTSDDEFRKGTLLSNRFEITARLASGGYGNIWQAKDRHTNVLVAIKILRGDAGNNDPHAVVRMRQEAEMLAAIQHPNIVKIYGFFSSPFGEFIAMELLRGFSSDQWLEVKGPASDEQTIRLVAQMLSALSACHKSGVIHRDLKPENIILVASADGFRNAKLVDFGIAKASRILTSQDEGVTLVQTLQGGFMGTPRYAAPELVVGDPFGPNIDLYSFGLVVAEWLTGRKRMNASSHGDVMAQVLNPMPIDVSDCPPRWRKWLGKMISRDPKLRFQSAAEAKLALDTRVIPFHVPADFVQPRGISEPDASQEIQTFQTNLEIDSGVLKTRPKVSMTPTPEKRELPPIEEFFGGDKSKMDPQIVVYAFLAFVIVLMILAIFL